MKNYEININYKLPQKYESFDCSNSTIAEAEKIFHDEGISEFEKIEEFDPPYKAEGFMQNKIKHAFFKPAEIDTKIFIGSNDFLPPCIKNTLKKEPNDTTTSSLVIDSFIKINADEYSPLESNFSLHGKFGKNGKIFPITDFPTNLPPAGKCPLDTLYLVPRYNEILQDLCIKNGVPRLFIDAPNPPEWHVELSLPTDTKNIDRPGLKSQQPTDLKVDYSAPANTIYRIIPTLDKQALDEVLLPISDPSTQTLNDFYNLIRQRTTFWEEAPDDRLSFSYTNLKGERVSLDSPDRWNVPFSEIDAASPITFHRKLIMCTIYLAYNHGLENGTVIPLNVETSLTQVPHIIMALRRRGINIPLDPQDFVESVKMKNAKGGDLPTREVKRTPMRHLYTQNAGGIWDIKNNKPLKVFPLWRWSDYFEEKVPSRLIAPDKPIGQSGVTADSVVHLSSFFVPLTGYEVFSDTFFNEAKEFAIESIFDVIAAMIR